ncbi:UTRA domain-containing protein [Streptomyces cyaneofuscatus]|uniref:UTRA domain-containing protein n=1 Tax=Streptomyces cyaneofuscatus TaxID=66883 RepID=UPI0036ECDB43
MLGTVTWWRLPCSSSESRMATIGSWAPGSGPTAVSPDRVASGRAYRRNEQTQTVSLVETPLAASEAHGLPAGAEVYARARLVKEGQQPTHCLTSYYRPEHVEGTRLVDPTPGPAGRGGGFRVLYDAGYEIDHMKEQIFARTATADESKLLQLPPGEPVVELHRTTYTADGTVVEFAIGVHAASRFAWEYKFQVPDSATEKENPQ